ncbi:hypothetical protein GCM10018793_48100 [Streptomyces sulfonofaciens]|uniref:Uncharacterized protein n=1 Tax=Streptomyces sulfonofaciens TaxID=68272 RepID=A0A919L4Y1_9ACTN|nr:hypothetical protein GCM10018793_48100 [Streptomyces sulfonofaciens]
MRGGRAAPEERAAGDTGAGCRSGAGGFAVSVVRAQPDEVSGARERDRGGRGRPGGGCRGGASDADGTDRAGLSAEVDMPAGDEAHIRIHASNMTAPGEPVNHAPPPTSGLIRPRCGVGTAAARPRPGPPRPWGDP